MKHANDRIVLLKTLREADLEPSLLRMVESLVYCTQALIYRVEELEHKIKHDADTYRESCESGTGGFV